MQHTALQILAAIGIAVALRVTCGAGAQAPDDDGDDDDRWIDEQIKKGTSGSADPTAVAAVRSAAAAAAAAASSASTSTGAYARQLNGLGAPPSSAGLWQQQQPEQLSRAGQDVMLTLQQGVAQLQVLHSLQICGSSRSQEVAHHGQSSSCLIATQVTQGLHSCLLHNSTAWHRLSRFVSAAVPTRRCSIAKLALLLCLLVCST